MRQNAVVLVSENEEDSFTVWFLVQKMEELVNR